MGDEHVLTGMESEVMRNSVLTGVGPGLVAVLAVASCDATGLAVTDPAQEDEEEVFCIGSRAELSYITSPDAIPALTDPAFVASGHVDASYLEDDDRVIALLLDGEPLAFPIKVLQWHEIVNLNRGSTRLSISYCPLTGTGLVFDRSAVGGAEFGVSGLLYRNNLVLYDRADEPSFFPQMSRRAECGPLARSRVSLPMVASWEIRWDAWKRLHPNTLVVSSDTGIERPYSLPPNAEYERIDNPDVLIPMEIDPRRPPKERVLGIPDSFTGGSAFPFEELKTSERLAIPFLHAGRGGVVFWERDAEAALSFFDEVAGAELSFDVTSDGFVDSNTGTRWRLDGLAIEGPLAGERLEPVPEAYVAFWFAWADFQTETWVWLSSGLDSWPEGS